MNAGVSAAGSVDPDGLRADDAKDPFHFSLNTSLPRLFLPSAEIGAVICDCQKDIFHIVFASVSGFS